MVSAGKSANAVLEWLLEPEDPGVRYLALRDLVGADEKELKTARSKAYNEGPIARILKEMDPEGYWVLPGPGYRPKFRSGVWSIMSLAQLGASIREDERIRTACNYLMDHALARGGQFSYIGKPSSTIACLQGNMLTSLMDLGCRDERLNAAFEWMARTVTGEGLPRRVNNEGLAAAEGVLGPFHHVRITGPRFICSTNKDLPCAWAGVNVLMAFSRLPESRRSALIQRAIRVGVDFFFSTDPATAGFPGHKTGIPDKRWWQFSFPAFGTDILRIAEAFTALGYSHDPKLANTLDLIQGKQHENGRWLLDCSYFANNKMWVKYGAIGKPNKWVTLRALRVLEKAGRSYKAL